MDLTTRLGSFLKTFKPVVFGLFLMATTALPAIGADAMSQDLKVKMKTVMQKHPELVQEIMANPHHALSMAYRKTLFSFGRALKKTAELSATVPPEFARTAVNEMKHSLDQLEKHHAEVLRTLPAEKKALLGDIPKLMNEHMSEMKTRLNRLDDLSKKDTIPSKELLDDLQFVLMHCQMGMNGMHGAGKMDSNQKMAAMKLQDRELLELVEQMNQAPDSEKIEHMAKVLTRLVQQRSEMHEHGARIMMQHKPEGYMGMHPHHMQGLDMEMDEDMGVMK